MLCLVFVSSLSDDTRVHTELLADALKRDGATSKSTDFAIVCSDGLTLASIFNDSDVLSHGFQYLDEKPGRGFEILRGHQKPASRYQSGHAAADWTLHRAR